MHAQWQVNKQFSSFFGKFPWTARLTSLVKCNWILKYVRFLHCEDWKHSSEVQCTDTVYRRNNLFYCIFIPDSIDIAEPFIQVNSRWAWINYFGNCTKFDIRDCRMPGASPQTIWQWPLATSTPPCKNIFLLLSLNIFHPCMHHIQTNHGLACMLCYAQCSLYNNRECSLTRGTGHMLSWAWKSEFHIKQL